MNSQMNGQPTKKNYTEPTALKAHYRDALAARLQQEAQAGRPVYDSETDTFVEPTDKLRKLGLPEAQVV